MKLPKARQRGSNWSISVMVHGKREYCTRDTEQECLQWAMNKLIDANSTPKEEIEAKKITVTTFHDLFNMYYKSHGRDTKSKKYIRQQLDSFEKRFAGLTEKDITQITPQDLTHWRNKRQSEVSDGTVLKEISLYSAVFTFAQKELFLIEQNPFFGLKKPKKPKSRSRRILQSEIEKIIAELKYEIGQKPKASSQYVAWSFLFALETAMRRGEILSIRKKHMFVDHIHLEDTKNGESRDIPLTRQARELIALIDHNDDRLIPVSENAFRLQFERAKARIGLSSLHFHDTRHEAITRLVNTRRVPVEILAKITGHKTIKVLVNTYYNPNVKDILKMLDD